MNSQHFSHDTAQSHRDTSLVRREPGVAVIHGLNWSGLRGLYFKEVNRFFKVQMQTIWAPAITTLLYLVIFTVAMGRGNATVANVPFASFIAPGLIAMSMMQNSFANSSFSLLSGKMQGTIVDYLMPPLAEVELLAAMVGAAISRAVLVGCAISLVMLFWPDVSLHVVAPWALVVFGILGPALLAFLGVITSIWAEKFDHAAMVTNFVVLPLSLLSGTFYSSSQLSPTFAAISDANPFHYAIAGFRYAFIGDADLSLHATLMGAALLLGINLLLGATCYVLLRTGWKLKP